jgi:cytochrome c oxidase subunit 2
MVFAQETQLPWLPPSASSFATDWEQIFWYINVVTAAAGLLVYAMIVYFCFAYARGDGNPRQTPRILGSTKLEIAWTLVPLFFFLTFFVWGVKVYNDALQVPADAPEYFVVGKQWMWKIQHPEGQREINELHLPVNTTVRITGTSEDVIHDFGIPAFRSKFDVVPGRYVATWYHPTKEGTYHIFCDQYCGMGHSQMVGKVHVLAQDQYEDWKRGVFKTDEDGWQTDGSPASEGRKLFLKLQCNDCHNQSPTARAPQLWGMSGKLRPVQGGRMVPFDRDYIERSIRNPTADVADGWKPIMPAFGVHKVDPIELRNLVAFIQSLKTASDVPIPTQQYPAPVGAPTTETKDQPAPAPAPKQNGGPKK